MFSIIMGALIYTTFVAALTAFMSEAGASGRAYRGKLDVLKEFMKRNKLPKSLRWKLRKYFELLYPGGKAFDQTCACFVSKPARGPASNAGCDP